MRSSTRRPRPRRFDAEHVELLVPVADPDDVRHAAPADQVDHGEILGQLDGLVQREEQRGHRDGQRARPRRDGGRERDGRREIAVIRRRDAGSEWPPARRDPLAQAHMSMVAAYRSARAAGSLRRGPLGEAHGEHAVMRSTAPRRSSSVDHVVSSLCAAPEAASTSREDHCGQYATG